MIAKALIVKMAAQRWLMQELWSHSRGGLKQLSPLRPFPGSILGSPPHSQQQVLMPWLPTLSYTTDQLPLEFTRTCNSPLVVLHNLGLMQGNKNISVMCTLQFP